MSAPAFLRDLEAAGIQLTRAGDELRIRGSRANIARFRDAIQEHKPALLVALPRREVLEAAGAVGDTCDPQRDDHLWRRWRALTRRKPVAASVPPAGWDGGLCNGCRWPEICTVLGPRGPHLPGGPCPAWPQSPEGFPSPRAEEAAR